MKTRNTRSCGCLRQPPPLDARRRLAPGQSARNTILYEYKFEARKRGYEWALTDEEFDFLTACDCTYCGSPPRNVYRRTRNGSFTYTGIDRVDNNRGYTTDNVVPCCRFCNRAKSSHPHAEFVRWLERVADVVNAKRAAAIAIDAVIISGMTDALHDAKRAGPS